MDDVARSWRLLLTLALVLAAALAGACARPPDSPAGVSTVNPHAKPTASDAGAAAPVRTLAILPTDFRTRYAKLSPARFLSQGHAAGRFDVEVYANDAAKAAIDRHAGTFAVGAVLAKEHWERSGDGEGALRPGPVMAMEKMTPGFDPEHGDWRYVVVSENGEVREDGKPDGCVLCHDDAPHDHVFKF